MVTVISTFILMADIMHMHADETYESNTEYKTNNLESQVNPFLAS